MAIDCKYYISWNRGTTEELENLVLEYRFYNDCDSSDIEIVDNKIVNEEYLYWDGWEEYLSGLSEDYPERVFTCDVLNEEGDRWRSYFKGGKYAVYAAEIYYPPFNELDLAKLPMKDIVWEFMCHLVCQIKYLQNIHEKVQEIDWEKDSKKLNNLIKCYNDNLLEKFDIT